MSKRNSEYKRMESDFYPTPAWVTEVIIPYITDEVIWEPACGKYDMANALNPHIHTVHSTDIKYGENFLDYRMMIDPEATAICTNPPFSLAQEFIEHALRLTEPVQGRVYMLLSNEFDHAKKRVHLFKNCPQFSKKINLNKRIVWFERTDGKKAAPSTNHSWYVWDWKHKGSPTIHYGPY